jgi:hypothetical protein
MKTLGTMLACTLLAACTWVELSEEGQGVTLVASVPESCKRLGTTTSVTKASLAAIKRGEKKVATELQTLARNAAASMGGDTLVAQGDIRPPGEQDFVVYRCAAS